MTYKTGFCGAGLHEGTKPKSMSGKPMKVCTSYEICGCHCHQKVSKIYQMTDTERVAQQNPEYKAAKNVDLTWLTPTESTVPPAPLFVGVPDTPATPEAPAVPVPVAPAAPTPAPAYAPTPSGVRARGQLEDEVYRVCKDTLLGGVTELVTPKFIAQKIDPENPPSVGAIGAVLDRWEKYGFAVIHKKPTRFAMFTREGMANGLEKMRADYKARSKR